MEETAAFTSKFQKCRSGRGCLSADGISELPDEILGKILSLLTMKKAARTSVISRRWKTLWKYYTGSLNLDRSNVIYQIDISKQYELLHDERVKYVRFVNEILNLLESARVDALIICFDLNLDFQSDIDGWIKFAIEKRARKLELDLRRMSKNYGGCYIFHLQSVLNNSNIKHLEHIDFHYVDASQQVVEYLLSNCPSLKTLAISVSQSLVGLNVSPQSSQRLRRLEIVNCNNLGFLVIEAMNLKSLTYFAPKARICLKNVPKLHSLSLGGLYCDDIVYEINWRSLSVSLSRIKKLNLDLTARKSRSFPLLPRFKNLKQLELVISVTDKVRFDMFSLCMLKLSCPKLYRVSVEIEWQNQTLVEEEFVPRNHRGIEHKGLRVVELRCFRGRKIDVDLARKLVRKCPVLEKVIIDTRDPRNRNENYLIVAKECAWQLLATESFNPGVELVVL